MSKKQDTLKCMEENKLNNTDQIDNETKINNHKNPGTEFAINPSNIPMNDDKNMSKTDHAIIVNTDSVIDSDLNIENSDILHFKMDDSSNTRIGRILWICDLIYYLKFNESIKKLQLEIFSVKIRLYFFFE